MTAQPAAAMPAAVILAGSREEPDPLALAEGVTHKALIVLAGDPLLTRVARALRGAGIERIAVSASDPEVIALAEALDCIVLCPASGPSGSVGIALETLGAPLLVTTTDHALLRPQWIRDFLSDADPASDVSVLLARRADVEAALPGSRRTWLRFADGAWSGCNLFLLATPQAAGAVETWQQVEAERKRPWRIAARLGWSTLFSFALGRLALGEAIARLGRKVGIVAGIVAARDGLAAVDVDKPADLADVRKLTEN